MRRDSAGSPAAGRRQFAVEAVRQAVAQGGLTLVVDGLAGMGKTFLLRELADAARAECDWPVHFVTADEIESREPFSFIERFAAGGPLAGWDFVPDAATQPITLARELVQRIRESVPRGAVILVDDAQWIDPESQRVLRYVIPRIHRRKVMLAFGVRAPHEAGSFGEMLGELVAGSPLDLAYRLEPLTVEQIRAFAADRLGTGISARTAERLLNATSGSFLRLDSILAQLTPYEVSHLHLTWDLPIRQVEQGENPLLGQFRALGPAARATTELVCLAEHEISRADLTAAAALLDEPVDVAAPIAAGVLSEAGFGSTIVPRHDLIAQAVRNTVAVERRRAVSRALASVTTGYRSVRHALQGADRWSGELAKQVDYYVADALEQGRFANAAEILRGALDLATDQNVRQRLLISLAMAHIRAKTGYLLLDLLEEYEQLPESALREFIVIILLAHRADEEFPRDRVLNLLALQSSDPDDRTIAAFLSFLTVMMTMRSADPSPVPLLIDHAKTLFAQAPADVAELRDRRLAWMVAPQEYLVVLDCYRMVHSQRMFQMDEVAAALPELRRRADELPDGSLKVDALVALSGAEVALGRLERGWHLARRYGELLDRVPEPWAAGTARLILGDCLVLRGEFAEAAALIELCEELAFDVLDVETRPAFAALRAIIAAVEGRPEAARLLEQSRVQEGIDWEGYRADIPVLAACEIARVAGDPAAVLTASEGPAVDRLRNTLRGFSTYRAHALIDLGRLDEAAQLIADLAAWRGDRWQEYWGGLDWLRARLLQARGDAEGARRHYAAAVEPGALPLPMALALADFGEFLISQGETEQGRIRLQAAASLLERIGARGYIPRVRAALDTTAEDGSEVRERLLAELTDRERQIARQLAEGRSNNQIAESLVVSVATVRSHVSNVLRKLHVSSRGEVARLLQEQRDAGDLTSRRDRPRR